MLLTADTSLGITPHRIAAISALVTPQVYATYFSVQMKLEATDLMVSASAGSTIF